MCLQFKNPEKELIGWDLFRLPPQINQVLSWVGTMIMSEHRSAIRDYVDGVGKRLGSRIMREQSHRHPLSLLSTPSILSYSSCSGVKALITFLSTSTTIQSFLHADFNVLLQHFLCHFFLSLIWNVFFFSP